MASWAVTTPINASEAAFTPSSTAPASGERRRLGTSGPLIATKTKAGKEDPDRRCCGSGAAGEHVSDERRRREDGPRRHLPDRHRVEELRLREPAAVVDQPPAQERKQHVPASE